MEKVVLCKVRDKIVYKVYPFFWNAEDDTIYELLSQLVDDTSRSSGWRIESLRTYKSFIEGGHWMLADSTHVVLPGAYKI